MKRLALISFAAILGYQSLAFADGYCREYTKDVNVGGSIQQAYGTACLQPDGSWQIVSEEGSSFNSQTEVVNYFEPRGERVVVVQPRPLFRLFGTRFDRGFHGRHYDMYNNYAFNDDYGWGRNWRHKNRHRWNSGYYR